MVLSLSPSLNESWDAINEQWDAIRHRPVGPRLQVAMARLAATMIRCNPGTDLAHNMAKYLLDDTEISHQTATLDEEDTEPLNTDSTASEYDTETTLDVTEPTFDITEPTLDVTEPNLDVNIQTNQPCMQAVSMSEFSQQDRVGDLPSVEVDSLKQVHEKPFMWSTLKFDSKFKEIHIFPFGWTKQKEKKSLALTTTIGMSQLWFEDKQCSLIEHGCMFLRPSPKPPWKISPTLRTRLIFNRWVLIRAWNNKKIHIIIPHVLFEEVKLIASYIIRLYLCRQFNMRSPKLTYRGIVRG
ncbi:uncharacterized protein [Rutidosis leptorrhynchoides]|uniref:uncharacterized protein n=1 Tax=Rutidosis leptorrhynchoides TaxID=125765 RepID=UPI003A996DEE